MKAARTTLAIREDLLDEVKTLSGARTKKEAVEVALEDFVRRRRARRLLELEGKVELSFTLDQFLAERKKDVPH